MFTAPDEISRMTVCPPYRSSLDIEWQRGSHPPALIDAACQKYYRVMTMGNRTRLTAESKIIL